MRVLKLKYEENSLQSERGGGRNRGRGRRGISVVSSWWKNICDLYSGGEGGGLHKDFVRRIGKGDKTAFWEDWGVGDGALKEKYNRLFRLSTQKKVW